MEVLVWDFANEEFLCSQSLRERLDLVEGMLFPDSLPEEDRSVFFQILRQAFEGRPVEVRRLRWSRPGVPPRVLAIHDAVVERDEVENPRRLLLLVQDLTVADSALQELLQLHRQANERAALSSTLLQEVNHRVKNNLQIVCSLLHSHRDGVRDAGARDSFRDIEARVRMIAHLHDRLSRGFNTLEASSILRDLAGHVAETSALPTGRLALDLQDGALELEVAQAMPFAMIANELLMNAIRHGTPDSRVSMQFCGMGDGSAKLTIRNACAATPRKSPSGLGMEIVRALCRQLDASFQSDFAWNEATCHVHLPASKGGTGG
jgi:two-component sensor histidine kinase